MRPLKPLCVLLAATAVSACGTVPFGGNATTATTGIGGIGWGPATGVTAGYAQARLTTAPTIAKDAKGNIVPLTVQGPCNRTQMLATAGILQGNASAVVTASTPNPGFNSSLAVNEGMFTGEAAILQQMAAVQAAEGQNHSALAEYNACPQANPAQASGAATTTPVP